MTQDRIEEFLAARPVAVVGASADRTKYGNIILRNLRERGWSVYAVNPRGGQIEGEPAWTSLAECPQQPALAVMVTPPAVTLQAINEASALGIERVWIQPGAESPEVLELGSRLGLRMVHDACIMVMANLRGSA